jgi:hypothetical protein
MRIFAVIIIVLCTLTLPAYAYLDPGTGSIVVQVIIGSIAIAGATLSVYWRKAKAFVFSIFSRRKQ